MSETSEAPSADLGPSDAVPQDPFGEAGYETPSPIQAQATPPLLEGRRWPGRPGPTASFARPSPTGLTCRTNPQAPGASCRLGNRALVREAERYAAGRRGVKVPVQWRPGLRRATRSALRRGVHIAGGYARRIMDHGSGTWGPVRGALPGSRRSRRDACHGRGIDSADTPTIANGPFRDDAGDPAGCRRST